MEVEKDVLLVDTDGSARSRVVQQEKDKKHVVQRNIPTNLLFHEERWERDDKTQRLVHKKPQACGFLFFLFPGNPARSVRLQPVEHGGVRG